MIIVIDNTTGEAYTSTTIKGVADIVDVSERTVSRWKKNSELYKTETANNYTIHFHVKQIKSKTGFAIDKKNIYTFVVNQ